MTALADDPGLAAIAIIGGMLDRDGDAVQVLWPEDLGGHAMLIMAHLAGLAATAIKSDAAHEGVTPGEYLDGLIRSQVGGWSP